MEKQIRSMTAFAASDIQIGSKQYSCSLKSLNSRFFDFKLQAPADLDVLEDAIRKLVAKHLKRGKVSLSLRQIGSASQESGFPSEKQVRNTIRYLRNIEKTYGIPVESMQDIEPFLRTGAEENPRLTKPNLKLILKEVASLCEKADGQKVKEGLATAKEIKSLLSKMEKSLSKIVQRRMQVVTNWQKKIEKRHREILKENLDSERMHQEIVLLLDRSDIHEEVVRLKEHIKTFRGLLERGKGKKMDFYTQELLRETNTIGSKAQDAQISSAIVDIKCNIERVRELVQNVE